MNNNTPYLDLNYNNLSAEVEARYQPTLEDIKRDPHYYAELVNDLMFHYVYGTKETALMVHAKKSLTNELYQ